MPDEVTLGSLGKLAALASGPLGLAQKYGPDVYNTLNEGLRPLFEEAGKLQHYGNEYYDAGPATLAALGTIGAPAAAGGAPLGALGSGVGKGIRAYHSSPHDFNRFDMSKIGTGEGAQVYGHGLYFAENPAVSGQGGEYWKQFLSKFANTPEGEAARELMHSGFDRKNAISVLERDLKGRSELGIDALDPEFARTRVALERLRSGQPVGPRTYEVNINAAPEQMLPWDAPLPMTHPARAAALDAIPKSGLFTPEPEATLRGTSRDMIGNVENLSGERLYSALERRLGSSPKASDVLKEAGIPGIKYLDQGSRVVPGQVSINRKIMNDPNVSQAMRDQAKADLAKWETENKTSNYVLFNDKIIDILRKYGLAGAAPAGGALMMQQDERQ